MSVALKLYEQLTEAGEDKTRAKLIAEAFEALEDRYPNLKEVATQSNLRETELRLQKDIELVRKEIKEVESRLTLEIKAVESRLSLEIKEVESRLSLETKEVEGRLNLEIKEVELKIQQCEIRLMGAIHRQTLWIIGAVGSIIGLIRLLDWLLASLAK